MKFCKDCVHLDRSMIVDSFCRHQDALYYINPVSGRKNYRLASQMRAPAHSKCGTEGKLFEQKISWFEKWFQK